jgi:large subunit ribosomal protein L15e
MWLRTASAGPVLNRKRPSVIPMARSFYSHIRDAWKDPDDGKLAELQWQRKQEWRKQGAIERIERPTRLDKARSLGYKAKQGIVLTRVSVRKGTARKQRHKAGRRTKRQGVNRISRRKSIQRIGEERVSRKYPNMRVLASYWVGEDGSQKWFETILVDPEHPAIENDDDLNWICDDSHKGRAFRGLTNAGKSNRGLDTRGKGSEHVRPSVNGDTQRGT